MHNSQNLFKKTRYTHEIRLAINYLKGIAHRSYSKYCTTPIYLF